MAERSELEEHIRVLTEFEQNYRVYIEGQEAQSENWQPGEAPAALARLRSELARQSSRAGRAMRAADWMYEVAPPSGLGHPALTEFESQVFAHETPAFSMGDDPYYLPRQLLDGMNVAIGRLEDQLSESQTHK